VAKHVFYNASVVVNGVDLSDHVESVSYTEGVNGQPAAAMGDAQDYEMPGTIHIDDININYYLDFAASKVYATHHPLVAARSTFTLTVKADAGANATTNPAFSISVFVKKHPFVNGSRGNGHMGQITYGPAGVQSVATS
jgi:hypothetical protein